MTLAVSSKHPLLKLIQNNQCDEALGYMQEHGYQLLDVMGRNVAHYAVEADLADPEYFYAFFAQQEPLKWQNVSSHLLNQKDQTDMEMTPIARAAAEGKWTHVEALVKCGVNLIQTDFIGRVPLHYVALHRNQEIFDLLKEAHDTSRVRDRRNKTPLDYMNAPLEERKVILKPFIGAQVNLLKDIISSKV